LRDSLLVVAESLAAPLWGYDGEPQWWPVSGRLFATLEAAVERYPEDPEIWYQMAEARFHFGYWRGMGERDALQAFDRVIALDSTFAPAYVHAVQLALLLDGPEPARRYARAYLELEPTDAEGEGIPLVSRILEQGTGGGTLDAQSASALRDAWQALSRWSDGGEAGVVLARALAAKEREPASRPLVQTLAFRGRAREAVALAGDRVPGLFPEVAFLGAMPAESVAAGLRRADPEVSAWAPQPWWAARRDTAAIRVAIPWADSVARADPSSWYTRLARYFEARGHAYLALARGDSAGALARFLSWPDSLCAGCVTAIAWDRLVTAELLAARGRHAEALLQLRHEAIGSGWPVPRVVASVLVRARVEEALGKRPEAIRDFGFVADVWQHADPELQTFVAEATAGLRRLGSERRR
jgi:serine/threonine-protein kinase